MPTYEITLPDGKTYDVDAPDEAGAQAAAAYLLAGGGPTAAPPPQPTREDQVRADYAALSTPRKMLTAADDVVRLIADGLTFGYADKLSSYMGGTPLEQERQLTQDAKTRAGGAGTAAEVLGAVVGPAKLGVATKAAAAVPSVGKTLLGRTALMAGEGAGYGALSAAGHDEDVGTGAAVGAGLGAAGNVAASALSGLGSKVAGAFTKGPAIPKFDETAAVARSAYDAADNAGIVFSPQAVDNLRTRVISELTDMGFDPALQPGAAAVVRRLEDLAGQNVTLKGLDTLRKVAGNGYVRDNRANNMALGRITQAIDDAVNNPAAGDVLMGDAQAGASALAEARSAWGRLAKAEDVQRARAKAELRADASGSGGNVDNATRQELRKVLERGRGRGLTPDETEALREAIKGSPVQNALRTVGKMSPTGSMPGMGAGLGAAAGAGVGGPLGAFIGSAALPAVAAGAKRLSDRTTEKNVQNLIDLIMAGGSKQAATKQPNAVQRFIRENRDNTARALTAYGRED